MYINHYKHGLHDSATPLWLDTPRLNITVKMFFFLLLSIFDCHITETCDFGLIGKKSQGSLLVCFCENATWTRVWSLDMSNSRDVIAGPGETHTITKDYYYYDDFFYLLSNHYHCKFLKKAGCCGSVKIDKKTKLLKVNVLSDAERLFGVTPKETSCKNNVILQKKSDWGLQSSQQRNNSTSLDSSPVCKIKKEMK